MGIAHSLPSARGAMRSNQELDNEFLLGERRFWDEEPAEFELEHALPYIQPGPYCLEARAARRKVILKTWMNTPKLYGLSDALGVLRYCRFIREQGGFVVKILATVAAVNCPGNRGG